MPSSARSEVSGPSNILLQRFPSTSSFDSDTTFDTVQEADQWTLRSTSTASIDPDLGMLSGKAILVLGKLEIRLLRRIWIVYRRRAIETKFPHQDGDTAANAASRNLGEMYDDLIEFTREDLYNSKFSGWAIGTLLGQIRRGSVNELQRALARTPSSLRLSTLHALCKQVWASDWAEPALLAWENVASRLARTLQEHYANTMQICNLAQIAILLTLSIRWPYAENIWELWILRLHECPDLHLEGVGRPTSDFSSMSIWQSGLLDRAQSLQAAGELSEMEGLLTRFSATHHAIRSEPHFQVELRSETYDMLIQVFARELLDRAKPSDWATQLILKETTHGTADKLQGALVRIPPSLRLPALYGLCEHVWASSWEEPAGLAWDDEAGHLARELQEHYTDTTQICNLAQIEILLVFSIRWPYRTSVPSWMEWFSRLQECPDLCRNETGVPKLDLNSMAIWRSSLLARVHSLTETGNFSDAATILKELCLIYDSFCVKERFDIEHGSRLAVGETLDSAIDGFIGHLQKKYQRDKTLSILALDDHVLRFLSMSPVAMLPPAHA